MSKSPGDADPAAPDSVLDRRRLLNLLLGGSFLAWAGVVAYPVLRYLRPPAESGGTGSAQLSDEEKKKLARESFVIVRLGADRVIVFRDSRHRLKALQAKCTHEGCTVQYQSGEDLIWCACHNGKFTAEGRVISGPPPRPLPAYQVTGDLTGPVTISRQGA